MDKLRDDCPMKFCFSLSLSLSLFLFSIVASPYNKSRNIFHRWTFDSSLLSLSVRLKTWFRYLFIFMEAESSTVVSKFSKAFVFFF